MKAEIISIGDELLIGKVINTNAAWLGEFLDQLAIEVIRVTTLGDKEENILQGFRNVDNETELVIITGGLGPTKDDITKKTICSFFETKLVFNEEVYRTLQNIFAKKGRVVSSINKEQAQVPEIATVLLNEIGTAPGIWIEKNGKIFISLPGVPYEMQHLMKTRVADKLGKVKEKVIVHKHVLTAGIAESHLAEKISDWEDNLPNKIKLAYLPSPGLVKLRLTARGTTNDDLHYKVEEAKKKLLDLISDFVYGFDNDTLETVVGEILLNKKLTVATAESCTGGYISHLITKVPGSSSYYKGSVIAYSYELKTSELYVSEDILTRKGAVSEEVVVQMAEGVRKKFTVDYAISCSGIAGPGGGTVDKPVGTVWIAIAAPDKTITKKFIFGDDRERNIQLTAISALNMLRLCLINSK